MGRDAGELISLLHTQLVRKQFQTQKSRTKSPKTNAQLGAPSNSGSVPVDVSDGEPKPCGEDVGGAMGDVCVCMQLELKQVRLSDLQCTLYLNLETAGGSMT